jgi:hypothetical protein
MKGQYRVIFEIMIFAIGVAITSFVLVNFQMLEKKTDEMSVKDQMSTVLNSVINGAVKASSTENSVIKTAIPQTISGRTYRIFVEDKENLTIIDMADGSMHVSRKIFNLDKMNDRLSGEVVSAGGRVTITYKPGTIMISRD